jgi:UDP-N-acetylmuramoyl-L-alanyl-D-glutamate--2,6-diaminopimelate ligase
MVDVGDEAAAIEASSHGSHYRRLDRVRFDALCFTNLTQDHLDLHGDMEEYFQAKRRLFTGLAPPPAAVNVGDPYGRRLADELKGAHRAPLVTFGLRPEAEVRADSLELGPHGSTFTAAGIRLETPLLGIFNVENVLAAVAAATLLDLEDDAIVSGIRAVTGVPGRFEAVDEGQDFAVVVDYSHKPDALDAALRAARQLGPGQLTVVFGAGGDRDPSKRPEMGRVARALADRLIVTNDNPRSEKPLAIVEEILQGAGTEVEIDLDRRTAIENAISGAEPGDVVLIAGKGHEQGQEIGDELLPFDDRQVARTILRRLGAGA